MNGCTALILYQYAVFGTGGLAKSGVTRPRWYSVAESSLIHGALADELNHTRLGSFVKSSEGGLSLRILDVTTDRPDASCRLAPLAGTSHNNRTRDVGLRGSDASQDRSGGRQKHKELQFNALLCQSQSAADHNNLDATNENR
ncbi:hypothetical protein FRC10_002830 [Ceratobasidium sp. 414]|nr:hypothetical protein FRC10_002830 [Ceratobasidium sp. 414]